MTKRQHVESSWVDKIRRGGTAVAAIGLIGSLAVAASGCDTVALISFSERSFNRIESVGLTPPQSSPANPDACEGIKLGTDGGDMRTRFVLVDNKGEPIQLGESVDNQQVELRHQDVELSNSSLMQVSSNACTSDDECATGFSCVTAPGLQDDVSLRRCQRADSGLAVTETSDSVEFISDTDNHQVFGLLMERSGSLTGWIPPGSLGSWDVNGDGDTSDAEDTLPRNSHYVGDTIATDTSGRRWGAVIKAETPWRSAYDVADAQNRKTYFGLWSFNDTRIDPTSYVDLAYGDASDRQWTDDGKFVKGAINGYASDQSQSEARANVYESIVSLINAQYTTSALENLNIARDEAEKVDKQLVVFVDGYDDRRDDLQSVIDAATDNNVRIFIVHLDPKVQEPGAMRDDPMYPNGQEVCSSDDDCKNFESCRTPRGYADDKNQQTSAPDGADYDITQTYCIPERDEAGRVGPIDDYAKLACATGGGYMYVPSAELIDENLSWTPLALDGLWEAKISSAEIRRESVPAGEPLRVHTNMSVTVSGKSRTYEFSQHGNLNTGSDSNADDFDTRGVVFTRDE